MVNLLEKYYQDGLVYKQNHPSLPLTIWNYTEKVQYNNKWDEITIQTRGLVTDDKGNVVARPFKKFFNVEENKHKPTEEFDVFEKMDGSLGILFNYEDKWVMATRGSFTSDQSIKGFELLQKYYFQKLHKNYTYLFEIIYKENRIVVDYDFEDLVLLGMIETKTGYEVNLYDDNSEDVRFKNLIKNLGFKLVKKYKPIKDYELLKNMIPDNKEGYVVRFSNGDRMKIKGVEYLRLHRIMTNVSSTAIWDVLSNGGSVDSILKDVPDEFFRKIKDYENDLKYAHYRVSEYCGKMHDGFRYGKYNDVDPEPSKKEFAEYIQKNVKDKKLHSVLYAMWDKKNYSKFIWNIIKPEFHKL